MASGQHHDSKTSSEPETEATKVNLMLIGKTGAGKGALGNVILDLRGQEGFYVNAGLISSPIEKAAVKEGDAFNRRVMVVDTPGVMDTSPGEEEEAVNGICRGIYLCCDGVDAFLIVVRLDVRLTEEEFKSIDKLSGLFGEDFWRYVILVFTHGDSVDNDYQTFKDRLLQAEPQLPNLRRLMSKLKTKPQLVDASRNRDDAVTAAQMKSLMTAVETLREANLSRKYTNFLFDIAQKEAPMTAELARERQDIMAELQKLKAVVATMQEARDQDKNKIEELEKGCKDVDDKLVRRENNIIKQMVAKLSNCVIL